VLVMPVVAEAELEAEMEAAEMEMEVPRAATVQQEKAMQVAEVCECDNVRRNGGVCRVHLCMTSHAETCAWNLYPACASEAGCRHA